MKYLRKPVDADSIDNMRINLSVQERKLSAEPTCDFCGDGAPAWVYASRRMSTGEMRECWRWTACEDCTKLVDSDRWAEMVVKIVKRLSRLHPMAQPHYHLAAVCALEEFHVFAVRTEKRDDKLP